MSDHRRREKLRRREARRQQWHQRRRQAEGRCPHCDGIQVIPHGVICSCRCPGAAAKLIAHIRLVRPDLLPLVRQELVAAPPVELARPDRVWVTWLRGLGSADELRLEMADRIMHGCGGPLSC